MTSLLTAVVIAVIVAVAALVIRRTRVSDAPTQKYSLLQPKLIEQISLRNPKNG